VWLNCPDYRRDVDHGGRFWDWPRGQPQCDDPSEVVAAIEQVLADETLVPVRERMVGSIYARPPGESARAAVAAILEAIAQ
jgi:hypothetical protein